MAKFSIERISVRETTMIKRTLKTIASGMMLLFFLAATRMTSAQAVTPVPKLNLNQYMGTWFEIERYPNKTEKPCVSDAMVLYALGDKQNSFQLVASCKIKDDNTDSWDSQGKLDRQSDGKLQVTHFLIFSTKYWVLATGPAYEWALVGSPNHKSLWILSRTIALKPEVLAEIKARAAAEGFDTSKLKPMQQHQRNLSIADAAPMQP
jgi:apolipoprotein D and lipocalin family protein